MLSWEFLVSRSSPHVSMALPGAIILPSGSLDKENEDHPICSPGQKLLVELCCEAPCIP